MITNFDKILINLGILKIKDLKADPSLTYRIKIKNLYDLIINNVDIFVEILNLIFLDRIHIEIDGSLARFEKDKYFAIYSANNSSLIPNPPIENNMVRSRSHLFEISLEIFKYNLVDVFWILKHYEFDEKDIEKLFGEFRKKMKPDDEFIIEKSINFIKDLTRIAANEDVKTVKYYLDNFPSKKIANTQASKMTFAFKIYEFYSGPAINYMHTRQLSYFNGNTTNTIPCKILMIMDIGKYMTGIKGWDKIDKENQNFIIPNISNRPIIRNDNETISIFNWICRYGTIGDEKYDIIDILLDKSLIKMNKNIYKNLMHTHLKNRDKRKLLIKLLNYGSKNTNTVDNMKNNSGILSNEEFINTLSYSDDFADEFMKDNRCCNIAKIRVSTTGNLWCDNTKFIRDVVRTKSMPTVGGKSLLYYIIDNENGENFNYDKTFSEVWRCVKDLDDDTLKFNNFNALEHIVNKLREYQYIPYANMIFKRIALDKPQFITEYLMGELQMYNMQPFLRLVKECKSDNESSSSDD